jgi:hypothetical protein
VPVWPRVDSVCPAEFLLLDCQAVYEVLPVGQAPWDPVDRAPWDQDVSHPDREQAC